MDTSYLLEHRAVIIGAFIVLVAFSGKNKSLGPLGFLLLVLGLFLFTGGIQHILSKGLALLGL